MILFILNKKIGIYLLKVTLMDGFIGWCELSYFNY